MKMANLLNQLLTHSSDHVVIITDCEPDDMIALLMLLPELKKLNVRTDIIVSCWQDVNTKVLFMKSFLSELFDTVHNFAVYRGMATGAKYNIKSLIPQHMTETENKILDWCLVDFTTITLIIQLAPISELLTIHKADPYAFNNTKMAIYGSFNIRSLLQKGKTTIEQVTSVFDSFKQILYYETFHATEPTTIESDIGEKISQKHDLVGKLIKYWNTEILKSCEKSLTKANITEAELDRTQKIIDSITRCPTQFVNADTGLIISMLLPLDDIKLHVFTGSLKFAETTFYTSVDNIKVSENCQDKFLTIHNGGDNNKKVELYGKHYKFFTDFIY